MNKQIIKIFAILFCIVTFAGFGKANPDNRPKFEIPFDFTVKNQKFPAGTYVVKRLDLANPNLVILKQVGGKAKALLLIQPVSSMATKYRLKLSFKIIDNRNVLIGILAIGEQSVFSPDESGREPQKDSSSPRDVQNPDVNETVYKD